MKKRKSVEAEKLTLMLLIMKGDYTVNKTKFKYDELLSEIGFYPPTKMVLLDDELDNIMIECGPLYEKYNDLDLNKKIDDIQKNLENQSIDALSEKLQNQFDPDQIESLRMTFRAEFEKGKQFVENFKRYYIEILTNQRFTNKILIEKQIEYFQSLIDNYIKLEEYEKCIPINEKLKEVKNENN